VLPLPLASSWHSPAALAQSIMTVRFLPTNVHPLSSHYFGSTGAGFSDVGMTTVRHALADVGEAPRHGRDEAGRNARVPDRWTGPVHDDTGFAVKSP
jgi:hypothetical protein